MESMYERIKAMSEDEMQQFIYWVYLNGTADGAKCLEDSPSGYFGTIIHRNVNEVMPNNSIDDLWDIQNDMRKE